MKRRILILSRVRIAIRIDIGQTKNSYFFFNESRYNSFEKTNQPLLKKESLRLDHRGHTQLPLYLRLPGKGKFPHDRPSQLPNVFLSIERGTE